MRKTKNIAERIKYKRKYNILIIEMKTAIVYSCFLYNQWVDIVKEQIENLLSSTYYKNGGEIHIVALGTENQLLLLKLICGRHDRLKIVYNSNLKFPVEAYGFQYMYRLCLEGYNYVGFVHSKGVTKERTLPITDWRKCMEYFVVDHALDAIDILSTTNHNCYGVFFDIFDKIQNNIITQEILNIHRIFIFPGNFFWIDCKWFISLPIPPMVEDRFFYERYLGCYEDVQPCYPFIKKYPDVGAHMTYLNPIPKEEYINLDIQKYVGVCP